MTDLSRLQGMANHAVTALEGRFFRPPLPEGYVPRARLCERLSAGLSGRLLLVSAPAGFGKSSLAVEFCQSLPSQWQSLWLGLSQRDADPGRFLERLLAGLQQYFPQLGNQALGLLKMRQRHQPFAFEEWLDGLLDELAMHLLLSKPLLLVLDDYHLVQGPVLDRCLQFLLNHLPAGLLVMVTSRQRPDWHLARLRLSRQLLELNEHDLRMTHDESIAVLDQHRHALSDQALNVLLQRSEGWVAGLRFWVLATTEAGSDTLTRELNGGEGLIRDYLLEEVIECLPADVQAFLYETACLERFSSALCDAARDNHDSAQMLRFLQAHQVFLVPLDEQGSWFRYHHLFSDMLRARAGNSVAPQQRRLHLNACRWYSEQGLLDEAIEQALRAGHPDVAANLVQSLSEEQLLAEQNVGMLLRWKMDLPDSLLVSTPRLIVLYAWALGLACQLDAAEELGSQLSRFLPAPSATAQTSMLAQWLALSGIIARGRGDRQTAERYCTEALASLPHKRYGQRLMCLSTLANLSIVDGDLSRARILNRDALELAQRVANPLFEALAHYDRARTLQARGETARSMSEVRLGLQRLSGLSCQRLYAVRARLTLYEGYLLVQTDDAQVGRKRLNAGLAEARACRDISVLIGHCVIAGLEGKDGRFSQAFAELAEAERLMHIWDVPPIYYLAMITLVKCELWLAQGRTDLADAWLLRLSQTYTGEHAAVAPECLPQMRLHIERLCATLATSKSDSQPVRRQLSREQPAIPDRATLASPLSDPLSVRELGVLQLIAQGCSNQEISERLFISLHTVKTHASHINSKLGVERRTQAVAKAQVLGLLG